MKRRSARRVVSNFGCIIQIAALSQRGYSSAAVEGGRLIPGGALGAMETPSNGSFCLVVQDSTGKNDGRWILSSVLMRAPPLHNNVTDAVRDLIVSGELPAGRKVQERALCTRFGVSRTPLREALKVLASEGLVQLMPRRGAFVAEITQTEIDELFPIMAALEALAAEAACSRMTDDDIEKLEALHRRMYGFHAAGAERDYLRLNREIHLSLFEIAGNASLKAMYEQLLVRTHSVRFVARKTADQWQRAVDEHVAIMAAIKERDGPHLAALLKSHLLETAVPIARRSISSFQ